jgi:hypothetical protein
MKRRKIRRKVKHGEEEKKKKENSRKSKALELI